MDSGKTSKQSSVNMLGVLLIGIPFLFYLGIVLVMVWWTYSSQAVLRVEENSRTAIYLSNKIMRTAVNAAVVAVTYSVTDAATFKQRFEKLRKQLDKETIALERHVKNQREMKLIVSDLLFETRSAGNQMGLLIENENGQIRQARVTLSTPLDRAGSALKSFLQSERVRAKEAARVRDKQSKQIANLIMSYIVINVFTTVVIAYLIYRLVVSRLAQLKLNFKRFSRDGLFDRVDYGKDEIARLDRQLATIARRYAVDKQTSLQRALFLKKALKVPMGSLLESLSTLANDQTLSEKASGKLDSCVVALVKADGMINRLIEVMNLAEHSASGRVSSSRCSLADLVDSLAKDSERVVVQTRYPGGNSKLEIEADRDQVFQLFSLLLESSNCDTRVSRVEIDIRREGRFIEIRFVEHGVNNPSILRRAIQSVEQGNDNQKARFSNNLETCCSIIDCHEGQISVETNDKASSTLRIRLPTAQGQLKATTSDFLSSLTRSRLMQRILSISLPPLLLTTIVAIVLLFFANKTADLLHHESQSQEMVLSLNEVMIDSTDAIHSTIDSMLGRPGANQNVARYRAKRTAHLKSFEFLSGVKTNGLAEDFDQTFSRWEEILKSSSKNADANAGWKDFVSLGDLIAIVRDTKRIDSKIDNLVDLEQVLFKEQNEKLYASLNNLIICLIVSTCLTVLVAMQAYINLRTQFYRRMTNVLSNTSRLLANEPMIDPLPGEDELAELDFSFHAAVSRLRGLEDLKVQIASLVDHDIRTPLSLVRNLLHMMRSGVWGENTHETDQRVSNCIGQVDCLTRFCLLMVELESIGLDESSRSELFDHHHEAITDLRAISPDSARALGF